MKVSKETVKMSQGEKLKSVENIWFEIGNSCTDAFDKNSEISLIRAGVAAHRCAMQAIRDQLRYKLSNK